LEQRQYEFDKMQQVQEGIRKYQLEEAGLQIEKMKLAKDYEFQTSRASIEIGNLVNTTDPSLPDFQAKLYGIASRYPAVMQSDVFKHAAELPEQSSKMKLEAAQAYHAMNPAPANAADEAAISNQVRGLEQQDIMEGKPPWTDTKRLTMSNQLRGMKEFKPPFKGGIAFDDQGRIQQVTFGEQPTVATASMVQKNLNTAEKNMQLLNGLSEKLRGADLGARGVIGEFVNKVAPQIGLSNLFDPELATNREVLKVTVQAMVRQISTDQRFSNEDRQRAEAAMIGQGWLENELNARQTLDVLRDIVRNRAKVDAQTGGMPIPEWSLSQNDIIDAVQSGKITKEKAIELRLKYHRDKYGPTSTR
jgi:hypothetical protein